MDENLDLNKNTEIEEALREFEAKDQTQQTEKVSETSNNSEIPKMVQLIMKWSGGAIKEQKQAEYVLLTFIAIAMLISLYLFFGQTLLNKFSSEKQIPQDQMMELYPELIIP
ncbi:MAG: hypothetical protein WA060_00595 [Minisyncoccia bacterium]